MIQTHEVSLSSQHVFCYRRYTSCKQSVPILISCVQYFFTNAIKTDHSRNIFSIQQPTDVFSNTLFLLLFLELSKQIATFGRFSGSTGIVQPNFIGWFFMAHSCGNICISTQSSNFDLICFFGELINTEL